MGTIFTMPPPKICDGKKIVQNFARFLTNSDFDREYLRNGSTITYQKSEKLLNIYNHYTLDEKEVCVLRSTNDRVYSPNKFTPQMTFFGRLHFCGGAAAPQIYYLHQRFTKACQRTPQVGGVLPSPKKNNGENLNFDLKFSLLEAITSGLVEVSSRDFFSQRPARQG